MSKIGIFFTSLFVATAIGGSVAAYANIQYEQQWQRVCDGKDISEYCTGEDGIRYSKYLYHEVVKEVTKEVEVPAVPAKTHVVHHAAVYGTKKVVKDCIRTNISYKGGTCALSRCRDGKYSGSTGWGTCNYHGGVWYGGGPWYTYDEVTYVVKPAWDETVVDVPAVPAHKEIIVVTPAQPAYYEKEIKL